jgi:phage-related protein
MDVETTSAAISMMANQGLKGSEAGTALNAVMRDMTAQMTDGAIAIGDTSVQVMDANGNYRDFADILGDVESAVDGMGDAEKASALQTTFTADSIKGLNLMLNAGSDTLVDFRDDLYNCGGAAETTAATMTDNLGGDVASMNSAFEELALKVWDVVEGPLRDLVQFITTDVAGGLSSLIEWLTTPTQQFDEFGNVVGETASPLQQFLDTVDALKPVIVAALAAIAGYTVVTNAANVVQSATSTVKTATSAVKGLWTAMSANPIGVVVALISALVAAIIYLWNTNEDFRNTVMAIWQAICDFFGSIFQTISDVFNTVWSAISKFVFGIWDSIYSKVSFAVGLVLAIISTVFNTVKNVVTTVWNAIYNAIKGPLNTAYNVVSTIVNAVKNVISTVFNGVKSFVSSAWNAIYNFIVTPIQNAYNTVKSVIDTIKSVVSNVFNTVKDTVSSVWNGIKTAIETPINAARDLVSGAIDAIKGFFNFSISWPHIPLPHFGINPSDWQIGDLLKGSIPSLSIDWYATGGVFNSPSVIGVGEAGAEAVVPLQGKYMQPFAQAVGENMDGGGQSELAIEIRALRRELPSIIAAAVPSALQLNKRVFARMVWEAEDTRG